MTRSDLFQNKEIPTDELPSTCLQSEVRVITPDSTGTVYVEEKTRSVHTRSCFKKDRL